MKNMEPGQAHHYFPGVWRLETYTEVANSQSRELLSGREAAGILIYTDDGWVSAQLTLPRTTLHASGVEDFAALSQSDDGASRYLAYCGRYYLDFEHTNVIHVPEVASLPELINRPQRRRFVFVASDRLELIAEQISKDGAVLSVNLTWRRSNLISRNNEVCQ